MASDGAKSSKKGRKKAAKAPVAQVTTKMRRRHVERGLVHALPALADLPPMDEGADQGS